MQQINYILLRKKLPSSNIYTFWNITHFVQQSPKFSDPTNLNFLPSKSKNASLTKFLTCVFLWPIQIQKDPKDQILKFILTTKYFSWSLPAGALISVAMFQSLFVSFNRETSSNPLKTWWGEVPTPTLVLSVSFLLSQHFSVHTGIQDLREAWTKRAEWVETCCSCFQHKHCHWVHRWGLRGGSGSNGIDQHTRQRCCPCGKRTHR